jgi:hypothetical protein
VVQLLLPFPLLQHHCHQLLLLRVLLLLLLQLAGMATAA